VIASIFATVLIPSVLFIVGSRINDALKKQDLQVSYLNIAVDVLQAPPTPESTALRDWAVDMLSSYSPKPLSESALMELRSRPLPTSYVQPGYVR
jgi:hypothetical protein